MKDAVRFIYNHLARYAGAEGLQRPSNTCTTNPKAPLRRVSAQYSIRNFSRLRKPHAVKIQDDCAFVTGNASQSICAFDISDLNDISLCGYLQSPELTAVHDITLDKNRAIVTCHTGTTVVVNISDPSEMSIIHILTDRRLAGAKRHHYCDGILYCATNDNNSLTAVDIAKSSSPEIISSVSDRSLLARANDVFVHDQYAFVSALHGSYTVIDISNPNQPTIINSIYDERLTRTKNSVVDHRDIAYVAASGSDTIALIDVSNPSSPDVIGIISDERLSVPLDVELNDYNDPQYLYVTFRRDKSWLAKAFGVAFAVFDIRDPYNVSLCDIRRNNFDMLDPQYITEDNGRVCIAADGSYSLNVLI